MYATIAFTIAILSLFSIIELLKSNQKFSLLKYYMLGLLIVFAISSGLDYIDLSGNPIPYYKEITKFIGIGIMMNMFCVIVLKKIPKQIIFLEVFMTVFFIIVFLSGFQFPSVINNQLQNQQSLYHLIFFALSELFIFGMFIYTFINLFIKKSDKNLYDVKVKRWTAGLYIGFLLFILIHVTLFTLFLNGISTAYNDSIISLFLIRFMFLLFILFRPKFLDDDKYARPFNQVLVKNDGITFSKFEFLFYSNNYYLNPEANMEDLALRLNVTKNEVAEFLKNQIDENFTELLNKNRVEYLKELLKAKKYESFTIEALSEMSGFNNRRSMYNAFNKYVGVTPTEFIQSLK